MKIDFLNCYKIILWIKFINIQWIKTKLHRSQRNSQFFSHTQISSKLFYGVKKRKVKPAWLNLTCNFQLEKHSRVDRSHHHEQVFSLYFAPCLTMVNFVIFCRSKQRESSVSASIHRNLSGCSTIGTGHGLAATNCWNCAGAAANGLCNSARHSRWIKSFTIGIKLMF